MTIKQAFLLCAGLGTRLRPITHEIPKPLLPIDENLPLLKFIVDNLRNHGVRRIVVNTFHLKEAFRAFLAQHYPNDSEMEIVEEEELLDTGGGLKNVEGKLTEHSFWLLNGDIYFKPRFRAIEKFHEAKGGIATLSVGMRGFRHTKATLLTMDRDGLIVSLGDTLRKGRKKKGSISCYYQGGMLLNRACFEWLPQGNRASLTDLLFRRWLADGVPFYGFVHEGLWSDIGTPEEYLRLNATLHPNAGLLNYSGGGVSVAQGVRVEKSIALKPCEITIPLRGRIVSGPLCVGPETLCDTVVIS